MGHDTEFPAAWDKMSKAERSQWLAQWFDLNVNIHQRIGAMNREKAEREWKNYRKKTGKGKRRR